MYGQQQNIDSNAYASTATNWSSIGQNDWASSYNNVFSYQQQQQYAYYPQQPQVLTKSYENFNQSMASSYQGSDLCKNNQNENSNQGATDLSELSDRSINNYNNKENEEKTSPVAKSSTDIPVYFTTQKIVNNTAKLSYTVYQLELLNAIYVDMKYPNSVQKTLIGKLIGITRDQVKIWFQNRRRKDTLVSQGKLPTNAVSIKGNNKRRRSSDESENNDEDLICSSSEGGKKVVEDEVINNVLYQLKAHHNAPSRLSSKRAKLTQESEDSMKAKSNSRIILTVPQVQESKPSNNEKIEYSNLNSTTSILTPVSCSSSSTGSSSSSGSTSSSEDDVQYSNSIVANQNVEQSKLSVLPQSFSIQDYIGSRYLSSYSKSATVHNQYHPSQIQNNNAAALNSWAYTIPSTLSQQPCNSYYKPSSGENLASTSSEYDVNNAYKYSYGNPVPATLAYDYASNQQYNTQPIVEQTYNHAYGSVANNDVYYNSFA